MRNRNLWISIGVAVLCILLMWWLYESVLLKEDDPGTEIDLYEQPLPY